MKDVVRPSAGAILLSISLFSQACSSLTTEHAITDAVLGAGGAGAGYAVGGAKGAAIGGGAGLLFGEGLNYFSDKKVRDAKEVGYVEGRSDEAKNLYWAQRNLVRKDADPKLKRKLVEIPVPAHYDADGQLIEASKQVVEVVQ